MSILLKTKNFLGMSKKNDSKTKKKQPVFLEKFLDAKKNDSMSKKKFSLR